MLCRENGRPMFQLRPDFIVEHAGSAWVVDAKWKLLDAADRPNHYGLAQADFYQMFAYGHRYLRGAGQLLLVYPGSEAFVSPLGTFDFGGGKLLHAVPLDLASGRLRGSGWFGGTVLPPAASLFSKAHASTEESLA